MSTGNDIDYSQVDHLTDILLGIRSDRLNKPIFTPFEVKYPITVSTEDEDEDEEGVIYDEDGREQHDIELDNFFPHPEDTQDGFITGDRT